VSHIVTPEGVDEALSAILLLRGPEGLIFDLGDAVKLRFFIFYS
jgi:hypothetical protein